MSGSALYFQVALAWICAWCFWLSLTVPIAEAQSPTSDSDANVEGVNESPVDLQAQPEPPQVDAPQVQESAAPQEPAAPPASATSTQDDAQWRKRYAHARTLLVDERFEEASAEFDALAAKAPTEEDHRLAIELADIAKESSKREEPSAQPRLRTSDELGILYTTGVFYGLGTGAFVALQLKPQSFGAALLPFALIVPATVGGIALADSYRPLLHGVPHAIAAGMYLGFGESLWIVGYQRARANLSPKRTRWHAERVSTALWIGATTGGLLGGLVGGWRRPTPGRVSFTASAAIWTGALGAAAASAITPDREQRAKSSYLVGAIGHGLGLVAGIVFGPTIAPSVARVRFLDLGGLGGVLLAAGGHALITNEPGSRDSMAAAAIGGGLGLGLMWFLTADMPADRSHDKLVAPQDEAIQLRPSLAPIPGGFMAGLSGQI